MTTQETCTSPISAVERISFFREALQSLGALYCRFAHGAISRPVKGKYRCWKCLREFELDW